MSDEAGYTCRAELPSQWLAKRMGRAGSLFVAVALLARLVVDQPLILQVTVGVAFALAAGMWAAPKVMTAVNGAVWETTLLWNAQTFAFAFAGAGLAPAVWAPDSLYTVGVTSALMVLMFLATFTEFCLGRVAYVVLLRATGFAG
ncbi:MAG: hypothetical protein ABMA64_38195 [Myxococcota bacterium]